jgi:hypothetical protein
MKTTKNKIAAVIIASFFILSIIASANLLSTQAHTPPWTVQTYAYVTATPNPWGLGSSNPVLIVFWINNIPPTAAGNAGDRWLGMTIDVTGPTGQVEHFGPFTSDPVGGAYMAYTPTQTGNYKVDFAFPTQIATVSGGTGIPGPSANNALVNDTFLGSTATTNFTVNNSPTSYFTEAPLPVSYWSRPINENNQAWSVIGSAWLGQQEYGATYSKYNPYGSAPNTAHVSQTIPLSWGGIVGGDNAQVPNIGFYSGTQYQLKFTNPIIMYGTLFYSLPVNNAINGNGVAAVDLRTGKTIWTNTNINTVSFGQLYDYESPNQHGTTGMYLWTTGTVTGTTIVNVTQATSNILKTSYAPGTQNSGQNTTTTVTNTPFSQSGWIALDPQTGKLLFNETNVPTGTRAYGPAGEWLIYSLGGATSTNITYLTQWNNTKLPGNEQPGSVIQWIPGITNYNMSTAYDYNVTLTDASGNPTSLTNTSSPFGAANPTIMRVFPGDLIFGQSSGLLQTPGTGVNVQGTPDQFEFWAINLNATRGPIGRVMWDTKYAAPAGNITVTIGVADADTNVAVYYYKETMQWTGIDMLTGQVIWGPTPMETPAWNFYTGTTGLTNPIGMGYGHMYVGGYGGTLRAYDLKTGNIDFTFGNDASNPRNSTITPETAYGDYPTQVAAIADGKVYLVEEEHSLNSPAYHGAKTRCVNATTGELIWDIYGISSWQMQAVADGYYTWLNLNEMQIYVMGPGPSATSVTATQGTVGGGVTISGTVTDQTPNTALKGTPAISDADQGEWMEYMVQHSVAKPTNVTGVPVHLTAIDPNGNSVDIGTVYSNQDGVFTTFWKPTIAGAFTVTATFMGSQAYGPSSAGAAFGVNEAAATTAPTATPTQSVADQYFIPAIAGLFVLIIIVAIVLALLMLRKK